MSIPQRTAEHSDREWRPQGGNNSQREQERSPNRTPEEKSRVPEDTSKPDTYWKPDRNDALARSHSSLDSNRQLMRPQSIIGPATCIEKILIILSYMLLVICFPVSLFCVFVVVRQFERAVVLRNGKVYKNKAFGPGLIHYLPCVDIVKFTDLRITCYAVPPQEALTKDSLTVAVDAVVYYKIIDPIAAVINVADYRKSTQYLAATTLRNALGTQKLSYLLTDRPSVCLQILQNIERFTRDWGIQVIRVEIKDIILPLQLQKAMATEAKSSRLANAKVIVAKAEIESMKNLQRATTLLMDNPLCMQLRYLQSLQMVASDKTHTIIFPFAVESMKKLFQK